MQFDDDLVKKLKHQDHSAFNTFYLETVDMFFRYIQANYFLPEQDSHDIISDFYVKFWESIKKYDENQSFTGYFWTIFKNLLKDHFKKNTDIPFTELESISEESFSFEDDLVSEEDITHMIEHSFTVERIQHAMKDLDDASKEVIYWKFIEEKSHDEIQLLLGISHDNLRQRISRAIKHLKSLLKTEL